MIKLKKKEVAGRYPDDCRDRDMWKLDAMISVLNYPDQLAQLQRVIDYGEELIDVYKEDSRIVADIVSELVPVIDERARYYSKYERFSIREGSKDLTKAIEDYSQVIDLLLSTEKEPDLKFYERRCEIYVELENWDRVLEDANRIISQGHGSKGYLLRSKGYWGLGDEENARADIFSGLEQLRYGRGQEWFDLFRWYRRINELDLKLSELELALLKALYDQGQREFDDFNLSFLEIFDCDFSNAKFSNVNFEGCYFRNVNFEGVEFHNVNFRFSTHLYRDGDKLNFKNSKFNRANLEYVDMKADFTEATLSDIKMSNARINYVAFQSTTFVDVIANQSEFSEGNFQYSKLERADFKGSNFQRTDFSNSEFTDINFSHADLFESVNNDTVMRNVNFDHANLMQASMKNVDLSTLSFDDAEICALDISGVKNYDEQKFHKAARGLFGLDGIPLENQLENLETEEFNLIMGIFTEAKEIPRVFRNIQKRIMKSAQKLIVTKCHGNSRMREFKQTPELLVDAIIQNFSDSDYQQLKCETGKLLEKRIFKTIDSDDFYKKPLGGVTWFICFRIFPKWYKKEFNINQGLESFKGAFDELLSIRCKIRETRSIIADANEKESGGCNANL